jgi:hypothetical protein
MPSTPPIGGPWNGLRARLERLQAGVNAADPQLLRVSVRLTLETCDELVAAAARHTEEEYLGQRAEAVDAVTRTFAVALGVQP